MPYCDVYVGRLSQGQDPLDWGGPFGIGNTPPRLSPLFPPAIGRPFSALIDKIKNHELEGKQIDWGAWAANVSRQQILDFIDEQYHGDRTYSDPDHAPHLYPVLGQLRELIASLPDERFALVAVEL
jgi:hypothetical protein